MRRLRAMTRPSRSSIATIMDWAGSCHALSGSDATRDDEPGGSFALSVADPADYGAAIAHEIEELHAIENGDAALLQSVENFRLRIGDFLDVFDAEGRFMGVLALPDRFQPLRVSGDRIYGVWRDELDVQHVMVLSLPALRGE